VQLTNPVPLSRVGGRAGDAVAPTLAPDFSSELVKGVEIAPLLVGEGLFVENPANPTGEPGYNIGQVKNDLAALPVELSCKSEYALLALVELSANHASNEPMQIRQIATQQNIPDRYLEQLLATLRRAGLVRSQRGARGGYLLARSPWQITLYDVVSCIEGFDTRGEPREAPETSEGVVVTEVWQEVRQAAEAVLQKYTLQDLQERCNAKQQVDIMYYI
jgi:Rrf2 family cysteine metabolism transcriptional repressor